MAQTASRVGRYVWTEVDRLWTPPQRRRIHYNFGVREDGNITVRCEMVAIKPPYSSCDMPWDTPDDAAPCPACLGGWRLREWDALLDGEIARQRDGEGR